MQCPWQEFAPATLTFCERQLCAWIQTPANTWSNLSYLIVGYVVCLLAFRENHLKLAPIGITGVVVGLGSFFFHASGTFVGEVIDISAMYFFISIALCHCAWRLWSLRTPGVVLLYLASNAVAIYYLVTLKWVGITIFAALCTITIIMEIYLRLYGRRKVQYKYLGLLVLFFAAAYFIWWLDISGKFCDPDNHFLQGHAIWHILNSFCFYFLYRYYCQFEKGQAQ